MKNNFLRRTVNFFITPTIYSFGFAIIETIFRQIDIKILKNKNFHDYTTLHQFFLTFSWTPIIIMHKKINNIYLRCFLYPINIYICEIIGGNILLYIFKFRAWYYKDRYALYNGMITLSYFPLWIILGYIEDKIYFGYIKKILF